MTAVAHHIVIGPVCLPALNACGSHTQLADVLRANLPIVQQLMYHHRAMNTERARMGPIVYIHVPQYIGNIHEEFFAGAGAARLQIIVSLQDLKRAIAPTDIVVTVPPNILLLEPSEWTGQIINTDDALFRDPKRPIDRAFVPAVHVQPAGMSMALLALSFLLWWLYWFESVLGGPWTSLDATRVIIYRAHAFAFFQVAAAAAQTNKPLGAHAMPVSRLARTTTTGFGGNNLSIMDLVEAYCISGRISWAATRRLLALGIYTSIVGSYSVGILHLVRNLYQTSDLVEWTMLRNAAVSLVFFYTVLRVTWTLKVGRSNPWVLVNIVLAPLTCIPFTFAYMALWGVGFLLSIIRPSFAASWSSYKMLPPPP